MNIELFTNHYNHTRGADITCTIIQRFLCSREWKYNTDSYFRWSMAILNKVKIRYLPKNHLYCIPSLFTPLFFTLPIYTNIPYPSYLHQYSLPFLFTPIFFTLPIYTNILYPPYLHQYSLPSLFTPISFYPYNLHQYFYPSYLQK